MQKYIDILDAVSKMKAVCGADGFSESWGAMEFSGDCNRAFFSALKEAEQVFNKNNSAGLLKIYLDGNDTSFTEVYDYDVTGTPVVKKWRVNFNKDTLINAGVLDGHQLNIFLEEKNLISFLSEVNTFSDSCPLSGPAKLTVLVADLKSGFGGPLLSFASPLQIITPQDRTENTVLPTEDEVKVHIHLVTSYRATLALQKYELSYGDFHTDLAKKMLTLCSGVFAVAVGHEFTGDKIVIDGLKRLEIDLGDLKTVQYNYTEHRELVRLVSWLYAERIDTRKKLFADRLTLDLTEKDTLLVALQKNLKAALEQANERYNFVILDRKDAYIKELKDLLKDLRIQSDLYAVKIRGLVSNFLRDVLGGIMLVGFTLFSKFVDSTSTTPNLTLISYVFNGLAVYYLVSLLVQVIVDIIDIRVTENELCYWKNTTKEYIPDAEFNKHRAESLKGRRTSFCLLYSIIALLYIGIVYLCFKYPEALHSILEAYSKK